MKCINEFKMTILSKSENESFARGALCSFVMTLDPTIDEISDIKTCVSEAVTNSIVHGYKGYTKKNTVPRIYITSRIFDNNLIRIIIKDKGCGILDIKKAMEPLFTTSETEDRAGMGFSIMESFMDKLTVRSLENKGTTIIMEKKIKGSDKGE